MTEIKFESTNGKAQQVSFKEAILQGQAPDKGLYVPVQIPKLDLNELFKLKGAPYSEIAFAVSKKFLEGQIPDNELKKIVEESYNFPVPIEKIEGNKFLMRLDRGPTAAFKDFAARMLARTVHYFLEQENRKMTILVATSGDTGGAVANAFHGVKNIRVVVLFPAKEVSEMQRRQMTTLGDNVIALAVDGKFDDCQAMVKTAFVNPGLKHLNLSSANSINFGRLMPQAIYYFYAFLQLAESPREKIIFSVPSGNFGNVVAGFYAREMGLPVEKFIIPTNANNEFPKFLETGVYERIVPSIKCISNAMNVGHPSNLVRLVHLYGGQMDQKGVIHKAPDLERMRRDVFSTSVSDDETKKTIKEFYEKFGKVIEPHGAVGWAGLEQFAEKNSTSAKMVSLETAHPAKFPEEIKALLGITPEPPESMKNLMEKEEHFYKIGPTPREFNAFLKYL